MVLLFVPDCFKKYKAKVPTAAIGVQRCGKNRLYILIPETSMLVGKIRTQSFLPHLLAQIEDTFSHPA